MLNDHDDKFEGHEEGEYHFTDEEASYEVEGEADAPKKAVAEEAGAPKQNIMTQLTQSKRMLISLGVFLVLVVVVYKLVSPSSSAPATDISAAPVVAKSNSAMPNTNQVANAQPAAQPAPEAAPAPAAQAMATPPEQPAAPAPVAPVAMAPTMPAMPTMPGVPAQPAPTAMLPQQPVAPAPVQQPQPQVAVSAPAPQMPAVIPVSAPAPTLANGPSQVVSTPALAPLANPNNPIDQGSAAMNAQTNALASQADNLANQQFNEYVAQNKALLDQVDKLTSRVSTMENQLSQLVQVLTRRNQGSSMANPSNAPGAGQSMAQARPEAAMVQGNEPKVAYNVQAIIPGRAWLKSENGETLTVAEGDSVKDLGRVTKIDPYDGVVEINTGAKSVSLSYGNG